MPGSLIPATPAMTAARESFHQALCDPVSGVLCLVSGNPSNADKSNKKSLEIAKGLCSKLSIPVLGGPKRVPQTQGKNFEIAIVSFLSDTLGKLSHLRAGKLIIRRKNEASRGKTATMKISSFRQYEHLDELAKALNDKAELRAALGNSYDIRPDIIIARETEDDAFINQREFLVDDKIAARADIRNPKHRILHASISAKWTLRSDRAQNSRLEALNLIRNRKGALPHVVVVTGEPSPGRLSAIALGTGDIDCVYHIALNELIDAVDDTKNKKVIEELSILVQGRRLKDISDLPFDLAL